MSNMATNSSITGNPVPKLKVIDSSLRLSVIPLSIASLWLTVTDKEDNSDYGNIQFSNFIGLKYMASVTAIAAAYALVALISSWIQCFVTKAWIFFVSDQVMAYLMVTSGGSVVEFLYLAYNGDIDVTWSEACNTYGSFCNRLKIAAVLHFLALFCFLALAIISAFRAFSQFEPPVELNSKQVEGGGEGRS